MAFVAEFTVPPTALPFGRTLEQNPSVRVEVDRVIPSSESALPFFWVWGGEAQRFIDDAAAEPEIEHIRVLERVNTGALFSAKWSPNAGVINGIKTLRATILESSGSADGWWFEVRAETRDGFIEFQKLFERQGIPVSLERLYDLQDVVDTPHRSVTPPQREALVLAYLHGYFDQPRGSSQSDLADEFDISRRAVAERLRRGMRNLIEATLMSGGSEESS